MEITIHFPFETNDTGLWIQVIISLFVLWIVTLGAFLKRTDLKEADRLVWAIVLCVLNIAGMILYWFIAPPQKNKRRTLRTDKEIKDYFNRGGDSK